MNVRLGLRYPLYPQMYFASATTIPADGGGAGVDGGAGGGGTPSGGPANTGGGAGAASPSQPSINWDTAPAQFREGYNKQKQELEQLRQRYEPWSKLGVQPEQVQQFQGGYQQVYTEVKSVADNLGIPETEVADAIRQFGLVKVLDHLRQEAWDAEQADAGNQDVLHQRELDERINNAVETRLSPVLQRENERLFKQGNALVETTINQLAAEAYKATGIDFATAPDPFKMFVLTGVTEALKYDDDGLRAIKFEGKTAPIQKAFQTFMSMFDAAYLARRDMEGRVRGGAPPNRPPGGQPPRGPDGKFKQPSLDEIINDVDVVRTSQGKPVYGNS